MEQTKALNALEPFLALSKSATSPRAASDLISQATSAPNTYVFAELLQTPNIQNLRSSEEYASYLTLLEIFAWGTWEDYKCTSTPCSYSFNPKSVWTDCSYPTAQPNLPKLSAQQHQKLLLLSLLPLSSSHTSLSYKHLLAALDLPTTRALEELITTAIYSGLITATLDPAHSRISVTSVAPLRDLAPGSLPALQSTLEAWSQRCDSALADLEVQAEKVKREAVDKEKVRRKKDRALEAAMQASDEKSTGKRNLMGLGSDDAMEIDDEGSGGRNTRGSKRTPGNFGFGRRLG
jgi:COP9 signalosome complex subunit 7